MTCSYRLPISSAALAGLILLAGCASTAAPASTADATSGEMAAFDEVVVAAPLEVTLSGAADHGVVVTADDDDADLVRITVDGGTLSLELDGDLSTRPAVAVSLPRADLARLEVAEAALVSTRDAVGARGSRSRRAAAAPRGSTRTESRSCRSPHRTAAPSRWQGREPRRRWTQLPRAPRP